MGVWRELLPCLLARSTAAEDTCCLVSFLSLHFPCLSSTPQFIQSLYIYNSGLYHVVTKCIFPHSLCSVGSLHLETHVSICRTFLTYFLYCFLCPWFFRLSEITISCILGLLNIFFSSFFFITYKFLFLCFQFFGEIYQSLFSNISIEFSQNFIVNIFHHKAVERSCSA